MQGIYLKFYVQENQRHQGVLAYEWLLEDAKKAGIRGGSAFRAIAGFGRGGKMHEQHFFELAGDLFVEVGFALKTEEAENFLARIASEQFKMFYIKIPIEMGIVGNGS